MGHLTDRQKLALSRLAGKSQDFTVALAKAMRASNSRTANLMAAMKSVADADEALTQAKIGFANEFADSAYFVKEQA